MAIGPIGRMFRALCAGIGITLAAPAMALDHPVNDDASLRAAILAAGPTDTITLTADITLLADLPAIQKSITIRGDLAFPAGPRELDADGFRGLFIGAWDPGTGAPVAITVAIEELLITNALALGGQGNRRGGGGAGLGAGIFVATGANVTLKNVVAVGNLAAGGNGGSSSEGGGGGGGMGGDAGDASQGGGGGLGTGAFGGSAVDPNGFAGFATGAPPGASACTFAGGPDGGGGAFGDTCNRGGSGGIGGTLAAGGFGGGGGGSASATFAGGAGGFGGGGGGGFGAQPGGAGGFGGGGGGNIAGPGGPGGFGGGGGASADGGGGGGAGLGGGIFVQQGGTLTVISNFDLSFNGIAPGSGGFGSDADGADGSEFGASIFVEGNGTLSFAPGDTELQVIGDDIADQSGSGGTGVVSVNKTGLGELWLFGANTYTGPTNVTAGILTLDGFTSASSHITVGNGAKLTGGGEAEGPVTVQSGGTIEPCCVITTGTLVIEPGGIFNTFADDFGADMIVANGDVTVTGATLVVDLCCVASPTLGDSVTILEKTTPGSIVGTFAGLPEGGVFTDGTTTMRISYVGGDGNDITLTFTTATVPGAPTIGTATAGNQSATVTFTAPASDGGGTITQYTVTSDPAGITATGTASPITVTGLTNGTPYTFTVTATNGIGTGAPSAPSNSVTPGTVPGAPVIGLATAGNAQATVDFAAPASNGGAAITSYTVTSNPGGITASAATFPITVTGLANGTAYTFTVTATNSFGTGPASAPSNSVTPATVPDAPTIGVATGGNAQATVAFTPPASNGGMAITSYTATSNPSGITASAASSPITVTGLANGTPYTFTVTATNAIGTGPPSAPSNSVTPAAAAVPPGAPTIGLATAGNAQATVEFTPPASSGSSAIFLYSAVSSPSGISASAAASPITVPGLTNGTTYTFTVTAVNSAGTGPPSAPSNAVTPATVPGPPTLLTATPGNGSATITFSASLSNGGSPITTYTLTCNPGGITASSATSPITVTGLANGTPYLCRLTATNALGTSAPTPPAAVTPSNKTFSGPSATGTGTITATFTGGGDGCSFTSASFIGAPPGTPPIPPTVPGPGIVFQHGLFDFTLGSCTPGSTIAMTIVYPAALNAGAQYYKYGPTAAEPSPHWYVMPATITGNTAVFSITDGGLGDDDLAANGTIVDQGGPGSPGTPGELRQVPTLDEWGRALLLLLMLATGMAALRRQRAR